MKKQFILSLGLATAITTGCFKKNKPKNLPDIPEKISNLITKDQKLGTGPKAEKGQSVDVHYQGWLLDKQADDHKGKKFDSSLDRKQPFTFRLGGGMVIKGWEEGVVGMQVGGKRVLVIPPELAYGKRGMGQVIPPSSTLIFEIELLKIR